MKRRFLLVLALSLVLSCLSLPALAEVPQPNGDFYVLDLSGVLSDETKGNIILNNDLLFGACQGQIVVVTVDSTGDTDIGDYACDLFNSWGIGSAEKNNGMLILLAIQDDDYYVLQGMGLEEALPSGTLASLNNAYLEPYFAQKDYDTGVWAIFSQIYTRVAAHSGLSMTADDTLYPQYLSAIQARSSRGVPPLLILAPLAVIFLLYLIL